jgi:hypothetical protein
MCGRIFKTFFIKFIVLARNVIFSGPLMARNVISSRAFLRRIRIRFQTLSTQKETKMFTVLSNPRNAKLYLIVALAIVLAALLTFVVVPSIAAPKSAAIPVTGASGSPDYFQRHPELRAPAGIAVEMNGDFALRHAEWASEGQNVAIPDTGNSEALDYYQRHPELGLSAATMADQSDYFARHPERRAPNGSNDLSDYFLRH